MASFAESQADQYQYEGLPTETSFRVLELLPGEDADPISCLLHLVDRSQPTSIPPFEAISYAWGDPTVKAPVICHGSRAKVTQNLHHALMHFRHRDRSRFLWADALCINQSANMDRNHQVRQMHKIYQAATNILVWLGPDNEARHAKPAVDAIRTLSDFLCQSLDTSVLDLRSKKDVYQEVVFKNRDALPPPNECELATDNMWECLVWLYSHSYFTRIWVIQELNANRTRMVHCGRESVEWERVELVAGYIIMESDFSSNFGFSKAHCWWAAMETTERIRQPKNWLSMLYLTSNFSSTDTRDAVYGVLSLMRSETGALSLEPDYNKSVVEVYRDATESALATFQDANVLLYATGNDMPSWIPRWNKPMLFRNPFRFGKALPWNPSGSAKSIWSIDKELNILSLFGILVDSVELAVSYNEVCFSNTTIKSIQGRQSLQHFWRRILVAVNPTQSETLLQARVLIAVAASFSFGLDEKSDPADERSLLHNFVAYLKIVLDDDVFHAYIPSDVSEEAAKGNGLAFGKPVWDFQYPESSFFITRHGLIGCCIAITNPGDVVVAARGGAYPMVLRPDDELFVFRGFSFVHGIMRGERGDSPATLFRIR